MMDSEILEYDGYGDGHETQGKWKAREVLFRASLGLCETKAKPQKCCCSFLEMFRRTGDTEMPLQVEGNILWVRGTCSYLFI